MKLISGVSGVFLFVNGYKWKMKMSKKTQKQFFCKDQADFCCADTNSLQMILARSSSLFALQHPR